MAIKTKNEKIIDHLLKAQQELDDQRAKEPFSQPPTAEQVAAGAAAKAAKMQGSATPMTQ